MRPLCPVVACTPHDANHAWRCVTELCPAPLFEEMCVVIPSTEDEGKGGVRFIHSEDQRASGEDLLKAT